MTIDDPKYDIFYADPPSRDTDDKWDLIKTPLESLDNKGNIRFLIPASAEYWMDWSNGFIDFEARIVYKNTAAAKTAKTNTKKDEAFDDKVMFINNTAHSLFSDFKVALNEKVVAGGDGNNHHVAYMKTHLQYTHAMKATVKITEGYHSPSTDHAGKAFTDWEHTSNKAIVRAQQVDKWSKYTLPLRSVCIMNQNKAVPPGKKLHIELTRNDPKFVIVASNSALEYDFEIQNMTIKIPMTKPTPAIQMQIAEKSRSTIAAYDYNDLRMFRYTIPSGSVQKGFFNVFQEVPIKLAFFTLFQSADYNNQNKRKFIFERHLLQEISLRTQGQYVSGQPLMLLDPMEAYRQFNRELKLYESNEDIGINFDEFEHYSNIWVFDCTLGGHIDSRQGGSANQRLYDLTLKFEKPTAENLDILCFFLEDKRFALGPGNQVISNDYVKK